MTGTLLDASIPDNDERVSPAMASCVDRLRPCRRTVDWLGDRNGIGLGGRNGIGHREGEGLPAYRSERPFRARSYSN